MNNFKNELFNVNAKIENGEVLFDVETVARSLGFVQVKNNKEYVRWETVNRYLMDGGFPTQVGKGDLISEPAVYLLAFKGETERALDFQKWLAIEVLPSIRKTGSYEKQLPTSPLEVLELTFHALKEQKEDIENLKVDVSELKDNSPMYPIECKTISNAVKRRGVELMGGKKSNAYRDSSIRSKVYRALYEKLRTEFGVTSYQGIKRKHFESALNIAKTSTLPLHIKEKVDSKNNQMTLFEGDQND